MRQCHDIFDPYFVIGNVHDGIHLSDDVENCQCSLNCLSAFPFENHICKIKKLVWSSNKPISQVFKRLAEKERYSATKDTSVETCISTKHKDNCYLLENENFVFLKEKKGQWVLYMWCFKPEPNKISSLNLVIRNLSILCS